jgi:Protein of unknown function (DUF1570)
MNCYSQLSLAGMASYLESPSRWTVLNWRKISCTALVAWILLCAGSCVLGQQLNPTGNLSGNGTKPASTQAAAQASASYVDWCYEAKVDVFHFHSDFELDDVNELHSVLGELRKEISESLQLPAVDSTVHVVLFSNMRQYNRYMQHYFPAISARRAIYLQDRGPGMLFTFWHHDIDSDLRHEATHAILNQTGVQLPLWLDEGIAEYFEIPASDRYLRSSYLPEIWERAVHGRVPSLLQLERLESMSEFGDDHYRDSWAWIHFLLHRSPQTRQLLIDYITRQRRQVIQAHLSKQLSELISDPVVEFQQHFSKLRVLSANP